MKVYVYIKIKEHPNPQNGGSTKGDVIYIYPMVADQGKLTLNNFIPVVMDLKIPCEDNFITQVMNPSESLRCQDCPYFDPDTCDVRRYVVGEWSAGGIDNPPKLLKKRKYTVDRSLFISGDTEILILKKEKTDVDKELLFNYAKDVSSEQNKIIIKEKI